MAFITCRCGRTDVDSWGFCVQCGASFDDPEAVSEETVTLAKLAERFRKEAFKLDELIRFWAGEEAGHAYSNLYAQYMKASKMAELLGGTDVPVPESWTENFSQQE